MARRCSASVLIMTAAMMTAEPKVTRAMAAHRPARPVELVIRMIAAPITVVT